MLFPKPKETPRLSLSAAEKIASEIIELATGMKNPENTIYVSSIVQRGDDWDGKVNQTNSFLAKKCDDENLILVNDVNPYIHVNRR